MRHLTVLWLLALVLACASSGSGTVVSDVPAKCLTAPDTIYFEFEIEKQPVLLNAPNLRNRGIRGEVFAQYIIDRLGAPEAARIRILKSDSSALADSARALIPTLRYRPGMRNGCPVRVLLQHPFVFK